MSTAIDHRRRQIARLDAPAPSWRTEPRYRGYCTDGHFLDSQGRLRFQPDPELARRRLELLLLDDIPPTPPRPLISTRVIDGRLPSAAKVRAIETAIAEVPAAIRAKLSRAGARIELIAGVDVAAHPEFSHHKAGLYCGMTKFAEPFAAVAVDADRDPAATVLHELGHILDQIAAHPSRSAG